MEEWMYDHLLDVVLQSVGITALQIGAAHDDHKFTSSTIFVGVGAEWRRVSDRQTLYKYIVVSRMRMYTLTCICSGLQWPPDAVRRQHRHIYDPCHIVFSRVTSDAPILGMLHFLCWWDYHPPPWAQFYPYRLELKDIRCVIRYGSLCLQFIESIESTRWDLSMLMLIQHTDHKYVFKMNVSMTCL